MAVWTKNANKCEKSILGQYEAASVHFEVKNESVTAVAFAPESVLGSYLIAVGLEVGVIHCLKWSRNGWERILFLDKKFVVVFCFVSFTNVFFSVLLIT